MERPRDARKFCEFQQHLFIGDKREELLCKLFVRRLGRDKDDVHFRVVVDLIRFVRFGVHDGLVQCGDVHRAHGEVFGHEVAHFVFDPVADEDERRFAVDERAFRRNAVDLVRLVYAVDVFAVMVGDEVGKGVERDLDPLLVPHVPAVDELVYVVLGRAEIPEVVIRTLPELFRIVAGFIHALVLRPPHFQREGEPPLVAVRAEGERLHLFARGRLQIRSVQVCHIFFQP